MKSSRCRHLMSCHYYRRSVQNHLSRTLSGEQRDGVSNTSYKFFKGSEGFVSSPSPRLLTLGTPKESCRTPYLSDGIPDISSISTNKFLLSVGDLTPPLVESSSFGDPKKDSLVMCSDHDSHTTLHCGRSLQPHLRVLSFRLRVLVVLPIASQLRSNLFPTVVTR